MSRSFGALMISLNSSFYPKILQHTSLMTSSCQSSGFSNFSFLADIIFILKVYLKFNLHKLQLKKIFASFVVVFTFSGPRLDKIDRQFQ